jgi:hypothetical protein
MGLFTNKYANLSDEQLRNLKVDVKKIASWESEINALKEEFGIFTPNDVANAIDTILEADYNIGLGIRYEEQARAKEWKMAIDSEKIIWSSMDYKAPSFVREGLYVNVLEKLNSSIKYHTDMISEMEKKGTSDSFLVRIATNKVNPESLKNSKSALIECRKHLTKVFNYAAAIQLINRMRETSKTNVLKIIKIEERLKPAKLKLQALEKFEKKHGKAFAKAAAAEKQTRQRATSIKRMVKKTTHCPYCNNQLGADAHLDHIYPVSKGGLSIIENLVWCCSSCNSLKSDKGLIQFLNESGATLSDSISRLQKLGKHV